jgi:hypothetical protein
VSEGARVWLVPDGYLPKESTGEQESHEAICVLNTSREEARIDLAFYFEDRDPIKGIEVVVPSERARHLRTDRPEQVGGCELPRGIPYAVRLESSVPVTVQHSRLDTSQAPLALMTTVGYPVHP